MDISQLSPKDVQQLNDFENFFSFLPTWAYRIFINLPHKIIFLNTGNQCISGDSKVFDPVYGGERVVQEITADFHVYAWNGEKLVIAEAQKPFRKELDNLYTIKLSNGQEFVASLSHRVLTPDGYKHISDVTVGDELFLAPSSSDISPLVHALDANCCAQTTQDSQCGCRNDHHSCDAQLQSSLNIGQDAFPLPSDALQHTEQVFLHMDAPENIQNDTHLSRYVSHPSSLDVLLRFVARVADSKCHVFYISLKHISRLFRVFSQPPSALAHLLRQVFLLWRWAIQNVSEIYYTNYLKLGLKSQFVLQPTSLACFDPVSTYKYHDENQTNQFSSYIPPVGFLPLQVISITFKRVDYKWDFTVPHHHNYFFAGAIHHNSMKTSSTAKQYVDRILGIHPIAKKNVVYYECEERAKIHRNELSVDDLLKTHKSKDSATWNIKKLPKDMKCPECGSAIIQHKRGSRVFRFASENLPGESVNVSKEGASAEVKNTQYPEFKKWLPKFLIKKDITARNKSMIISDIFGGPDIIVEYVSYNQPPQGTAGTQRLSVWEDEQPDMAFHEEQLPRLLAEDGDLIITCTPADRISWLYDDVFEKAKVYFRTQAVIDAYAKYCARPGMKSVEKTSSPFDVAVIQAATDDNPTLVKEVIEEMFKDIDEVNHPEVIAIRRYGIFKQVSGRIFKSWSDSVHIKSASKYFPDGIPKDWTHGRGVDYHPTVPWACEAMSLSPQNELFIWAELNPSPEQKITGEIARELAKMGSALKFTVNLIDPLATVTQGNTGYSTMDDLNRIFHSLYKEGSCMPTSWQPWDTKSQVGRDEIKKRLKNSVTVGKPFNNKIVHDNGRVEYLPTMWVLDVCRLTAASLKNWRLEEWANTGTNQTKEMKETPQQKWSHFCMVIEGLLKHQGFRPRPIYSLPKTSDRDKFFQGRVAV